MMKTGYLCKNAIFITGIAIFTICRADTIEIGGKLYECRDGMCLPVENVGTLPAETGPVPTENVGTLPAETRPVPTENVGTLPAEPSRILHGNVDSETFIAFLRGETERGGNLSFWGMVLLALVGGFCLNLTPCVLPLAPVTLMVIGRSAVRGVSYALGLALAYGALGAFAVLFGMAFGAVQGSPWFNAAAAVVFVALGLASWGAYNLDFSRRRNAVAAAGSRMAPGVFAFFMGIVCAVLSGACVAPVVATVLAQSAALAAAGNVVGALALPLALGVGMAAPWPFAAAGLKALPRPGRWMMLVNKILAIVVFAIAARYAYLAATGFSRRAGAEQAADGLSFADPAGFSLDGLKRPVVVDCWASWCGNCRAMEKGTLADPRVREALAGFTFVRLRAEDIGALRRLPGFGDVRGLPAFLVFE